MEEKTPVLVAEKMEIVPEHRAYEDFRVTGNLPLGETLYMCVKQYDTKGGETVLLEKKMTNDKDLKGFDCAFVAKANFMDAGVVDDKAGLDTNEIR